MEHGRKIHLVLGATFTHTFLKENKIRKLGCKTVEKWHKQIENMHTELRIQPRTWSCEVVMLPTVLLSHPSYYTYLLSLTELNNIN